MADATPVEIAVLVGLESTIGEVALIRRGGRVSALGRGLHWPWLGGGLWVAGYPALGEADWTPATRELGARGALPDLSRVVARGEGMLEVTPLRASNGWAATALRLTLGLGVLYSVDDPLPLPADQQGDLRELSPAWSWGVAVDTWRLHGPLRGMGVQLRCGQSIHREIYGEDRYWRDPVWIGVDLGLSRRLSSRASQ